MSIYRRFAGHDAPSLITTNVAKRQPLFADSNAARALTLALAEAAAETKATVLAYVVMPDHLHLVLGPNERTSHGRFMRHLKGRFAHRWNRTHNRSGAVWQARFHEKALRTEKALIAAVDYVHHNPVAAGLVDRPEDYPWSSARQFAPEPVSGCVSG